jgi:hypothetical protein
VVRAEDIGVGPSDELSLRVSAAALARVVFFHPDDGIRMLALEHKATVARPPADPQVTLRAQPFGGAVRIRNVDGFSSFLGGFAFDSKRSQSESDFRIFVGPSSLDAVHEYCLRWMGGGAETELETDPSRELWEEFRDALRLELDAEMYAIEPVGIVLEDRPTPTRNVRAPGVPTARIYWVYEVEIRDVAVCRSLLTNSITHSAQDLRRAALSAHERGEPGWANAALVLRLDDVRETFEGLPPEARDKPVPFQGTVLAGNVVAVFEDVAVPKYERIDVNRV